MTLDDLVLVSVIASAVVSVWAANELRKGKGVNFRLAIPDWDPKETLSADAFSGSLSRLFGGD